MILYNNDFEKYKAFIDYRTKNKSFIKMATLLSKMGIKNNKFFLALHQKELIGIDPHYPNLSTNLQMKILYECKINIWYFIREVIKIPAQGSDGLCYILNRANLAMLWTYLNNIDLYLTMPRQIGKTIAVLALTDWLFDIAGTNLVIGLFARGSKLVNENVKRLKSIRAGLPKFMIHLTTADTNNKEGICYDYLNNSYKTFTSTNDKIAASEQGKGESFALEHWDEMAFYNNNFLAYGSAIPATDTAGAQARASGLPIANIITSTSGDLTTKTGIFAHGLISNAMRFNETFYDSPDNEHTIKLLDNNSLNHMMYIEYDSFQLGKTQSWLDDRERRSESRAAFEMNYLNKWQHGSNESLLTKSQLDNLNDNKMEPTYHEYFKSLIIKWYVDPLLLESDEFKLLPIIVGEDTSDNVGRDFTTLVLTDPRTLAVVATCRCNKSNLISVAKCVIDILTRFPRSIFIPERNKNGAVLLDYIIDIMSSTSFNPLTRIYNTIVQNLESNNTISIHNPNIHDVNIRKSLGFTTTSSSQSRERLYKQVLSTSMHRSSDKIRDKILTDELSALTIRNGRVDHPEGGNDDMAVAYLLTCYFILYGKNLHIYGLESSELLSTLDTLGNVIDTDTHNKQRQYRYKIKELEIKIDEETSLAMKLSYKRELNYLTKLLDGNDYSDNIITANQLQEQLKQTKQTRPNQFNNTLKYYSDLI